MNLRRYSLLRVLFVSMVVLAFALLLMMQFVDAGPPESPPTAEERLTIRYWLGELVPVVVMVVTTTGSIWLTLQLALRPMRRLSKRAGSIGPDNLNERLPLEAAPAEIVPLVSAFNHSLDRLESAWSAQRAFSANAAHELRTPLAALRAHVESLLPAAERREATAEFDRLGRLIEQLLLLAEADQDHLKRQEPFDLVLLVRDISSDMTPKILGTGREIGFHSALVCRDCRGDSILAGIAIRNLIENATRHTPKGAHIAVAIDANGVVVVRDDGPRVPKAFEDRLFQRFAKSNPKCEGAGLGLSIVARIMDLHAGKVWFERPATGAIFHLAFPEALGAVAQSDVAAPKNTPATDKTGATTVSDSARTREQQDRLMGPHRDTAFSVSIDRRSGA